MTDETVSKNATFGKLVGALIVDAIGMADFWSPIPIADPFFGEVLTPLYIGFAFKNPGLAVLGFIEEAAPFSDIIPTATMAWGWAWFSELKRPVNAKKSEPITNHQQVFVNINGGKNE